MIAFFDLKDDWEREFVKAKAPALKEIRFFEDVLKRSDIISLHAPSLPARPCP